MTAAELITYAVSLLAIVNPVGNLALFTGMTSDRSKAERHKIAATCFVAILVIFLIVTWSGPLILKAFGITLPAFQAAGGLIVLLLALSMLNAKTSQMHHNAAEAQEAQSKPSIGIVPLAIPIVGGPGAITTIIIQCNKYPSLTDRAEMSLVAFGAAAIVLVAFLGADLVQRLLGTMGINIVTRIMGIILAAIGFGMLGAGVKAMLGT